MAEGRKLFLLYLKPIINGTGNYYIESRTRSMGRTDVVIDYLERQTIVELKVWRGNEYNKRGGEQPAGYLEDYHVKKGYLRKRLKRWRSAFPIHSCYTDGNHIKKGVNSEWEMGNRSQPLRSRRYPAL